MKKLDKSNYGYLFILPFFIVFLIFSLYPMVYTFYLSFYSWDGMSTPAFVGAQNFDRVITDEVFRIALVNTVRIWLVNFIPQMGVALLLAGIFTFNKIKGMNFFRSVFYLPNLVTAASIGVLFNLFFQGDNSVVNSFLVQTGILEQPFSFFASPTFTSNLVSYTQWWMWFGYTLIIVMAGMTTIDHGLYEAAQIDGATKFQIFSKITLPLIRPTMMFLTLTSVMGGMQIFDVPATLTDGLGSPQRSILTVAMYIYNTGFRNFNMGYAAALSISLFAIVAVLTMIYFFIMNRRRKSQ